MSYYVYLPCNLIPHSIVNLKHQTKLPKCIVTPKKIQTNFNNIKLFIMTGNTTAMSTSLLIGFLEILSHENEFSSKLLELANWIREERYYETIICMRHDSQKVVNYEYAYNTDKIIKKLMCESEIPIMNLKGNTSYYLWYRYNRRIMAIAHLNGNEIEDRVLLATLWRTLKRNILTRMILVIDGSDNKNYIKDILNYCFENKVINVLVISGDILYSMKAFPEFEMRIENLQDKNNTVLFIDQVKNMHRFPIRLITSNASSRCLILGIKDGEFILGGYVGHFFSEYARKHNASLTFPNLNEASDDEMFLTAMDDLVENGTYDASTELSINIYTSDLDFTRTYDYLDWCMMVPIEQPIPAYKFYVIIFDTCSLVLFFVTFILLSIVVGGTYIVQRQPVNFQEMIFNIYILSGLLGQAFKSERGFSGPRSLIFIIICLAGLVFNTNYVTYLQTFNTRPPRTDMINSLDDIRKYGMKIAVYEEEYSLLMALNLKYEFRGILHVMDNYAEYFGLRNNFDTRYIFPVALAQWTLYEQQQKFFAKPRFRFTNICIIKMFGMQIPLQPGSPYVESMNTLIDQVNQAGLVNYWKSLAFLESVRLKRVSLFDKSTVSMFEPMKLDDMRLLMVLFVFILIILCICFVFEVYWPHRGEYITKFMRCIKRIFKRK
ncbi:LOW QUALITY PROTEIN: uncharacterized protein ACRADG_000161 [Cochliomyia hominivorax]